MKFTEHQQNGKWTINFDYYDKETGGGGQTIFHNSEYNCKLGIIDYCDGIFKGTEDQMKERFALALSKMNLAVSLNTHRQDVADFINKNYEVYSHVKIPIGYPQHGGVQHHFVIRNTLSKARNLQYQRPISKETNLNTPLVERLEAFMKKRRRKTDIVPELVQIIQATPVVDEKTT